MEMSGAVVAAIFNVVLPGQGRDQGSAAGNLVGTAENDLGAAEVEFDRAADFDGASGEAADVADIFEVGRENDYREGAGALGFTEVEVVDAFDSGFDAQDFAGDAASFSDVLAGGGDGKTVRGEELSGQAREKRESREDGLCDAGSRSAGRWPAGWARAAVPT